MTQQKSMKDTERTQSISLPNVRSNPFGSNISGEKAYRRAERVAAALYVLTKYMSDMEPLRTHTRSTSHLLLTDILKLRTGFRVESEAAEISQVHARVRETISITQLLAIAGFASQENADMVTRALEELSQFVEAAGATHLAERTTFTREDLLIDQTIRQVSVRPRDSVVLRELQKGTSPTPTSTKDKSLKGRISTKDNLSSRKIAILEVLKDGKRIGIKDIASFVVGCSEKTVQRELAALVSDGILEKEGEKRWSKYFVA